ncbi:hypothetical protein CWS54_01690 [Klebsiella michiganensis]|nr:hypothetical protein [Klebsiella michiganensis]
MEMIIFGKALSGDGDGGEGDEQGDQQEDRKKKRPGQPAYFCKKDSRASYSSFRVLILQVLSQT